MVAKTVLNEIHRSMGAKMVDFGGWDMPLHYGSQLKEHLYVRQHAGMFDVSHMTVIDIGGPDALRYLQMVMANNVAKLSAPGSALYTVMLNDTGGVIDDLIVYFLDESSYRLVVNCGTREKDLAWLAQHVEGLSIDVRERQDLGIVAIQGPAAKSSLVKSSPELSFVHQLDPFSFQQSGEWLVACTGYTGEDGLEMIVPNADISALWQQLNDQDVYPCGLGARDTLRLEAGYCLYGNEMDEATSPWSANLGWTIALKPDDREFIGREALENQKAAAEQQKLVGLVLEDKGVLRAGQKVVCVDGKEGVVTSGSYSPTMEKSIALARLPMSVSSDCDVLVRNKKLRARIVGPAFVRHGKILV